ncbi:MAG: conjugal transfer protein TraX [Acetatifactor sp.]|nr:conjugal transfer protein TraX [Acetatifactor sp.]
MSSSENRHIGISGAALKMIAVITMFIDHFAAVYLFQEYEAAVNNIKPVPAFIKNMIADGSIAFVHNNSRLVGRLAFPIYCFLLIEGFKYTHDKLKYCIRLWVFALISQIPFGLAFANKIFDPEYVNVFFTLAIGFVTVWIVDEIKKRFGEKEGASYAVSMVVILLFATVAELLNTDYGALGIILIALMYITRYDRLSCSISCIAVLIGYSLVLDHESEIFAIFAFIPIWLYNGERGRQWKYFFYWFYPVHLLALWALWTFI